MDNSYTGLVCTRTCDTGVMTLKVATEAVSEKTQNNGHYKNGT
jgi:hypothetical protein